MSDFTSEELEAEAEALIERMMVPKRRVRPRLAEALRDAEDREIETPSGGIMAWRLGKGPATLLVHGWEDDNCLWGPLVDRFRDIGRAVVVLDLPGHGFTPAEDPSLPSASAALRAVAEAFGPVDSLVAHSFGCPVSIHALSSGLSVGRAALIASPNFKPGNRWARAERRGVPPEIVARAAAIYDERHKPAETPFDLEEAAEGMTAKALFVHSLDDEECPADNAQALKRRWPGAKLALADGLGHRLIAQDAAMLDRIVDFIEGFER